VLAPFTDAIVFNAARSEARFRECGIAVRTCTIRNGVELPTANYEAGRALLRGLGVPDHVTLVGNVAQLDRRKNHELFLRMASLLVNQPSLHFVIVGDGPERGRLEGICKQLGLGSRVTFTGRLEDPIPVISCLRVKVLTSHLEGMPNSVMEAMALGVPCVVTSTGGNAELITDGVHGFVVAEPSPEALKTRVEQLLGNPQRWQAMSDAARHRIASEFSVDVMVQAYENLFSDIIGPRSASAGR
jgi:glycosyltransferase involved in cell wall biosynthesis